MNHRRRGKGLRLPGLTALAWLGWVCVSPASAEVLYVDADASGPVYDGSGWCSAYVYLQDALAAAADSGGSVTEIRVADGLYNPDQGADETPGDRHATFQLITGVALRGGYAGCGAADPDDRDIEVYETILSGDLAENDAAVSHPSLLRTEPTRSENSCHVVTGSATDETAIIDGFTITAGNVEACADPPTFYLGGAGMLVVDGAPAVVFCTFNANSASGGGGLHSNAADNLRLSDCSFIENTATSQTSPWSSGGAVYPADGSTVTRCTFVRNYAAYAGGAVYARPGTTIRESTFNDNESGDIGGGLFLLDDVIVEDCTFVHNSAGYGGGIYWPWVVGDAVVRRCVFNGNFGEAIAGEDASIRVSSSLFVDEWFYLFYNGLSLRNCTLVNTDIYHLVASHTYAENCVLDNVSLSGDEAWRVDILYSVVNFPGGWPGEGNIEADPLFVNRDAGDYHLLPESPAINAGVPPPPYADVSDTDLDGYPRLLCSEYDMGAFEFGIGDYDCDREVTLWDFASWQDCMSGPQRIPYPEGCQSFDFEFDGDVDLVDFAGFQQMFGDQ